MTRQGIDYAFGRPDLAAVKAAGKTFVVRYVSGGRSTKDITRPELAALRARGLDVGLVWETSGGAALGGRSRGVEHAMSAKAQLHALGMDGTPVYFAVDFQPVGSQLLTVTNYIAGAASVLGYDKTGVYGGLGTIDAVYKAKVCRFLWQTYAWSGGKRHPAAQLHQYRNGVKLGGASVDLCEAVAADFGQFPRPVKPKPPVVSGGGSGGTGVPTPRVVSLADLRAFRSSQSALIVSQALVAEKLIGVARSLWNPVTGNGKAFRVYRNAHGGDTVTALRVLGKAHGFTVTA